MIKVYTRHGCNQLLTEIRNQGKKIGFVPTMGALHQGHLSLIDASKQQTDFTMASIFVNPEQFNDKHDYEKYPRVIDDDLQKLENTGCDGVFIPSYDEIYSGEELTGYGLGNLESIMEGAYRPGHFQGVAMVVDRLFNIIQPSVAYFGEKDFQQLQVIKHIVNTLNHDVKIVACPIIRENDGLAMSSRNLHLSKEQRKVAPEIYKALIKAEQNADKLTIPELKNLVVNQVNQNPLLHVEYFEIVNEDNMQIMQQWKEGKNMRGCIAVVTGDIRLIDNIKISS
jgi:pantoate--beta-alanine ligase